ncbi:MAG: hypothetical protein EOP38_12780 [Rubrivivax sp.]|nr:MAG: hypothetical protein EOP38_12780 [Rubrivivax sp.]
MCLIIKKPAGRTICADFLKNAWQRNFHGWGGFYVREGEVVWARGLEFDELIEYNRQLPVNVEACLHLRKATYGDVNHDMAHPYVVRPGLMLMHNGSIPDLAPQDPSVSDTSELARLLGDLLAGLTDDQASAMVRSQGFAKLTAPLIEGSMVVLMDKAGLVRLGREWHAVKSAEWNGFMAGIEVSNVHTWCSKARQRRTWPAWLSSWAVRVPGMS